MEEKLAAHKPQSDEDISFVKGHYKKRPNSHIHAHGNDRPHTKPPGKSLHSNTVKNVERNGYIKKALAQHKDAHVEMWKTKSLHQDV